MQKKYCLLILAFAFMLGTIVASLPPVKAQDTVRFYVWNYAAGTNIYPGVSPPGYVIVEVWIDSPEAWDNTPEGIVGYALSVRVDPRALEVVAAGKIRVAAPPPVGFLEGFLIEYGYGYYDPFIGWVGRETKFLTGPIDATTGTIIEASEYIMGYTELGVGAGGGPQPLMRFAFKSRSDTLASPIDLCGPWDAVLETIEITAIYTTVDGTDHYVDVLDDGYYIAETPDTMFVDALGASPYDPHNPIGSKWHELWPEPCREWSLDSWEDNGEPPGEPDGILDPSDQIDMTRLVDGYKAWYHVEWVNPEPVEGDGKADLIVKFKKEVPEFPLGVGLMIALAPAIPIVYLWRTRKKGVEK